MSDGDASDGNSQKTYDWNGRNVPKNVYKALKAPFRGQQFGSELQKTLDCFDETPQLLNTLDTPTVACVRTELVCKYDSKLVSTVACHRINAGKLLPKLFKSPNVPDEVKLGLCNHSRAKCAIEWKSASEKKRKAEEAVDEEALNLAEEECEAVANPHASKMRKRQSILDARTVFSLGVEEATVITYFLSVFFFACRIPWAILDNFFFREFVRALNPAYHKILHHRDALRTTHLDMLYTEVQENVECCLDAIPGKETLGLDGKTDIRGRSTVNVTRSKQAGHLYVLENGIRWREGAHWQVPCWYRAAYYW
ncbi:hypothetical protein CYMTET_30222 [Cymbomonas tetramitiformis]|uniref:Uncharacterized protein n=1 Tax=Cymbomonas tetramitiformis TaxID=36881 RepID=A0AAE0FJA0_9CHLO|nr:hypothetical protein CYMTET_30222 [Cymbomonas tetramitiformis]